MPETGEAYAFARSFHEAKQELAKIHHKLGAVLVRLVPSFTLGGTVAPVLIKADEHGTLREELLTPLFDASPTHEIGLLPNF